MNDDRLRAELARIAGGLPPDASLPLAALTEGRRRVRRRRDARGLTTVLALTAALGWYGATGPTATPATAAVACYRDRVVVTEGRVASGRSGVRLDVTNETGDPVRVIAGDEAAIVAPGRSAVDVGVRPGRVAVRCDSGAATGPAAYLTVTDRRHVFVDDALDCARPSVRTFRGAGDIEAGDPVALTGLRLAGGRPESAGYPGASGRRLVRVRDGAHVVGLAVWHAMPEPGTWTLDEIRVCAPGSLS